MNLTGLFVSYILGVPSVKAEVIGLVGDNYVLLQEYDTVDDGGNKIHVKKEYYRNKWFIDSYHEDQFEDWCDSVRLPGSGDDNGGVVHLV